MYLIKNNFFKEHQTNKFIKLKMLKIKILKNKINLKFKN